MTPVDHSPPDTPTLDQDLAEQARPGHGVPSQDTDPAAQFPLPPDEAKREAHSVLAGGGLVGGAAVGSAVGATLGGPVGVLVGGAVGAIAGTLGGVAAGTVLQPGPAVDAGAKTDPSSAIQRDHSHRQNARPDPEEA